MDKVTDQQLEKFRLAELHLLQAAAEVRKAVVRRHPDVEFTKNAEKIVELIENIKGDKG